MSTLDQVLPVTDAFDPPNAPANARNATPLPVASPESQGFSPERLKKLSAALTKAVANREVGGLTYARHPQRQDRGLQPPWRWPRRANR